MSEQSNKGAQHEALDDHCFLAHVFSLIVFPSIRIQMNKCICTLSLPAHIVQLCRSICSFANCNAQGILDESRVHLIMYCTCCITLPLERQAEVELSSAITCRWEPF